MLQEAVTGMGFEVRGAASAEQGLRALAQGGFGVVVLDLNLPGMSGMEVMEIIRRQYPNVQVVILTGFGSLDAARKAIRQDVVDFITKPCQLDELELSLSRAFARWRRGLGSINRDDPTLSSSTPTPLDVVERSHILASMKRHHGNRRAVAGELGISLRTLYNRLKEYKQIKSVAGGKRGIGMKT